MQIADNQTAIATVEDFSNGTWSALPGAAVTVGTQTFTTDNSGRVNIGNQDGYYQISASKNRYIRSNAILLQIGQPNSGQVNLTANISPGQVLDASTSPGTIAFSVNPTSLDFGNLTQNAGSTKSITITNTGNTDITVKSAVSGDNLFTDNLTINLKSWRKFSANVNAGQNQNEPVTLMLPKAYTASSGQKTGQLIFWATAE